MPFGSMPPENPAGQSGTVDADTHTMGSAPAGTRTRSGRARYLIAAALLVTALFGGGFALFGQSGEQVSTQWPRPYDPAKPFNMLGVPGVSVEQRKRAEDLLLKSLQAAPLWADYHALVKAGWYSIEDQGGGDTGFVRRGFEHITYPEYLYDGQMLNPERPESLVYKVDGDTRTFVAYMFMAEPGITYGDPELTEFAGRLIGWHDHSDMCWKYIEGRPVVVAAGFKQPDGTCSGDSDTDAAVDPRVLRGEVPEGSMIPLGNFLMTHVWVIERACGPFAAIQGPGGGVTQTPEDERVDICQH